jgi:hypothetical protein
MRYLCLIYLDEQKLAAVPPADINTLNAQHLDYNDRLRRSGHFIAAEALAPAAETRVIRVRPGEKTAVTDGPFAETKEMVAGFYLIDARDIDEAVEIAARLPSASLGTIEVRPARQLHVDGREPRWG